MSKKFRVAIMIDIDFALKHHQELIGGIQKYVVQTDCWQSFLNHYAGRTIADCGTKSPYDGIIGRLNADVLESAKRFGLPAVNIWHNSPVFPNTTSVVPDQYQTGVMAANHLISRGLRSFAMVRFPRYRSCGLQQKGFLDQLSSEGFDAPILNVSSNASGHYTTWHQFVAKMDQWIVTLTPPVGIFVTEDILCRYVAAAVMRCDLNVPNDVALISGSDEPLVNDSMAPTLSGIDLGFDTVGFEAAKLLHGMLKGDAPPEQPILLTPKKLMVRQSTDVFSVDDPVVSEALRFISENSHEAIRVDDVADHVDVSRRNLERKFRESIRRSIADEIVRLRIERVKRRLVDSNDSIQVLAIESGFTDTTKMCRVFRRTEGISPGEYRKSRTTKRQ